MNNGKIPYNTIKDNYKNEITTPFTVKCISTKGELYKIDN